MKVAPIQPAFSGGEWAPALYYRIDLDRHRISCRTMENFFVHVHGGASNRAGTAFVGPVREHDREVRLIPFQPGGQDSMVLEFGHNYMRPIRDRIEIYEAQKRIDSATQADPVVILSPSHNLVTGDMVYIRGCAGMTEINDRFFTVTVIDLDYFSLDGEDGTGHGAMTVPPWGAFQRYISTERPQHIREAAQAITSITKANPAVVAITGHGYATGDTVYIRDASGMIEVNDRFYNITRLNADTFSLDGVNSTGYENHTGSTGFVERLYTLATPYEEDDLEGLRWTQDATTLTITHPEHAPYVLSRTADTEWSIDLMEFGSIVQVPVGLERSVGVDTDHAYVVTTISPLGEESLSTDLVEAGPTDTIRWAPPEDGEAQYYRVYKDADKATNFYGWVADVNHRPPRRYMTGATAANPVVITSAAHGLANGTVIYIRDVAGMVEINDRFFTVANAVANTFELSGEDGTLHTPYTSGGMVDEAMTWTDNTLAPDMTATVPIAMSRFEDPGDYPTSVAHYQQRLFLGGSANNPQTIWASQTGFYANFNVSHPFQDTDSLDFALDARQSNAIVWMVQLEDLIIGTIGAEWRLGGASKSEAVTPTAANVRVQSHWGCASVPPLVIGNTILFVQYGGSFIRDMTYSLEVDGYTGNDITIMARHLFEGYSVREWAYQRDPYSIVWVVRSDGTLLGLTYLREQQVFAWHKHTTEGTFESVATVSDGQGKENAYFSVVRTVDGNTRRYVERLAERIPDGDLEHAYFVDSGKTFCTQAVITGVSQADPAVVTAPSHGFSDGDLVDIRAVAGMTELNWHRFVVANSATNTFEITTEAGVDVDSTGYEAYLSGGTATLVRETMHGLDHLEGCEVAVLANGSVESGHVVTDGTVTLHHPASIIAIGLPYACHLETQDFDVTSREGTSLDLPKQIDSVALFMEHTRCIRVGPDLDHLVEVPFRTTEPWGSYTRMHSGTKRVAVFGPSNESGRVHVYCEHPLPVTLLAVIPRINFGGR